jgi:acylphosphatase
MLENARVFINIYGQVQGVFFRSETQKKAVELGLTGWVKNNFDGSVEILAEGEKDSLEKIVEWCYEGSDRAKVEKIDYNWLDYMGEFNDFKIS